MENEVINLSDHSSSPTKVSRDNDSDDDVVYLEEKNPLTINDLLVDLPAINITNEVSVSIEDSPNLVSSSSLHFNVQQDSGYDSSLPAVAITLQQEVSTSVGESEIKKAKKKKEENEKIQKRKMELEKKRQKLQQEKLLKQVEKTNSQLQKPEEMLRNCRAIVDKNIETLELIDAIGAVMRENDATFTVESNPVPNSIIWRRTLEIHYLDTNDALQYTKENVIEDWMVVIWDIKHVVVMIDEDSFVAKVGELCEPGKKIMLLINGAEKYFSYQKGKSKKKDCGMDYKDLPKISRMMFESVLVEIQIDYNCSNQLVEKAEDIALVIYQFTKSIALMPIKIEKWKKLDNMESYVVGEKKDLVAVSNEGYGLKRLWQKQLCQFNLCSLETAEAICSVYGSLTQLMQAYKNCSKSEGELLLKDIPVRRAAGVLKSGRKVGPELSKKIYLMFTSTNGDLILGSI